MNLLKGDLATVCSPCSPMIKLAQDGEEEAESSYSWNCSYLHLVGDLLDLWGAVKKSPLNFRDKISFSLLMINLPRNKRFENWKIR